MKLPVSFHPFVMSIARRDNFSIVDAVEFFRHWQQQAQETDFR